MKKEYINPKCESHVIALEQGLCLNSTDNEQVMLGDSYYEDDFDFIY